MIKLPENQPENHPAWLMKPTVSMTAIEVGGTELTTSELYASGVLRRLKVLADRAPVTMDVIYTLFGATTDAFKASLTKAMTTSHDMGIRSDGCLVWWGPPVKGLTPRELALEMIHHEVVSEHTSRLTRGIRAALKSGVGHFRYDKQSLHARDFKTWGWKTNILGHPNYDKKMTVSSKILGCAGVRESYIDPEVGVAAAREALKASGEPYDIQLKCVRRHLGVVNRTPLEAVNGWIAIHTDDIDPSKGA